MTDPIESALEKPRLRQLCSTVARSQGLDPIGSSYAYDHFLIVEAPPPWPLEKFDQPGPLPAGLIDLFKQELFVEYPRRWASVCLCIIAPDKGYCRPGLRRLIYARRPDLSAGGRVGAPFALFEKTEYLVPEEEVVRLAWALFVHPQDLPRFERWRQPAVAVRDYFVCTDGLVDRACAVAGMKLYSTLRKLPEAQAGGSARVWRTSHFGGHVYAATLLTLPDGRMWGFLDGDRGSALLRRQGEIGDLRGCYRGWIAARSPFINVVERELMMRYGWGWFDYMQSGEVTREEADAPLDAYGRARPRWGEVELCFWAAGGAGDGVVQGRAIARVEVSHVIETVYASDRAETIEYAQYRLAEFEIVEG